MNLRKPLLRSTRQEAPERGAALVEMALILPVLMALLLGITSGGASYNKKVALTDSVRAASRFGATLGDTTNLGSLVAQRLQQVAATELTTADVCVELVRKGSPDTVVNRWYTSASSSACPATFGSAPATPTMTAGFCVVKVWAKKDSTLRNVLLHLEPEAEGRIRCGLRDRIRSGRMLTSLRRPGWRRSASDEQGAVLVICVLVMTSLLIVAGLVVDIAVVRTDRQQNKSAADVAVAAGMRSLEISGYPAPFRGVCEAVKYLKLNHPELSAMAGSYTDGDNNGGSISSDPVCPRPGVVPLCARTPKPRGPGTTEPPTAAASRSTSRTAMDGRRRVRR